MSICKEIVVVHNINQMAKFMAAENAKRLIGGVCNGDFRDWIIDNIHK